MTTDTQTDPTQAAALNLLGVAALVVRAASVFGAACIEALVGPPPSAVAALPGWVAEHHVGLAAIEELAVIGAVALVPAAVVLHRAHAASRRTALTTAWALLAALAPTTIVLAAVHGRIVYPVYGIDVSGDATVDALVLTIWIGGMHAVSLVIAASAAFAASAFWSTRHRRRVVVALAMLTCLTQLLAAFPWLFDARWLMVFSVVHAAWYLALAHDLRTPTRAS